MSDWRAPLNFGLFYYSVYGNNTVLYQYKIVNILIEGERPYGQAMSSKYCRNIVPISGDRADEVIHLSADELIRRIMSSGITDLTLAAHTLARLLGSEHIEMGKAQRQELMNLFEQSEPQLFIARMLPIAVACPRSKLQKLTIEMKTDIANYALSDNHSELTPLPGEKAVAETVSVPAWNGFTQYNCQELTCASGIEPLFSYLPPNITDEEKAVAITHFKSSNAIFAIEFTASVRGLSDLLLHRIQQGQSTFASLNVQMRSQREFDDLRAYFSPCIDYVLAKNAPFLLSFQLDDSLPAKQYRGVLLYSLCHAQKEKSLCELINNSGVGVNNCISLDSERTPGLLFPKDKRI